MHNISELAGQKTFLREIVANDYRLPENIEAVAFIKALLPNLGSTDAEMRDRLTYYILLHLILDTHKHYTLTGAELEDLLLTCIDKDHLFYHIGETDTDSVFMRSFSLLIFPLVFNADASDPRISEPVVRRVFEALQTYARQEHDWRGYVKGKGWAHAAAHLSDALDDCVKNRFLLRADGETIMETLAYLAQLPEPLAHEEDDRLAFVAYGIITRQTVDMLSLKRWIASVVVTRSDDVLNDEGVRIMYQATNAKNFLRSLYFLLSWSKVATLTDHKAELLGEIDQALQKLKSLPDSWFENEQ